MKTKPHIDYGTLTAIAFCFVAWAAFIYILSKWAGWLP
jgi:hypothetical protein